MQRPAKVERSKPAGLGRSAVVLVVGLALGFGGLYVAAGRSIFRIETYRVGDPSVPIIALCAIAFLFEWFGEPGLKLWVLCRNQKIPISLRSAVLVHLAAMFAAAVTPGNAAVGPATAVALRRLVAPFGRGMGVAVQVSILDMIYFAWAVPVSLGFLIFSSTIRLPAGAEVAALAVALLSLVGAVFLSRYPRLVVRLILAFARLPLSRRYAPRLRKVARDYYRGARAFRRMPTPTWLALQALTAAGWFSGFVLFWLLLELYGADAGLPQTLALLNSIVLVSHLVPTPGGSGFIEAALGLSVGAGGVAGALIVWRLLTYHVIFLLGPLAGWLLYLSQPASPTSGSAG